MIQAALEAKVSEFLQCWPEEKVGVVQFRHYHFQNF
jgi:hypothetical protein